MDRVIYEYNSEAGYVVVFQDSKGKLMKALIERISACRSLYLAELLGCKNLSRPSILEVDAHNVTITIIALYPINSEFGFIVEDCKEMLTSRPDIFIN